jgi:hypothetical protein
VPQLEAIYRSSARRAFACVWLFRAVAAVGIPYVAAGLWRLSQPEERFDSIALAPKGLVLSTTALALMALVTVAVRLGAFIAFITWLYRATKNLPALGVADAGVTPGWAIGCWFVPFVNIIAPCIVVLRVWRASGPESAPADAQGAQGWPLLYAWWGAFLALSAAGFVVWFARAPGGPPGLLTRTQVWAYLCSAIATIVMSLLAVRVVREIERRQTEKSQLQAFA